MESFPTTENCIFEGGEYEHIGTPSYAFWLKLCKKDSSISRSTQSELGVFLSVSIRFDNSETGGGDKTCMSKPFVGYHGKTPKW